MDTVKVIMKMESIDEKDSSGKVTKSTSPVVFFPELPANLGMILCYAHLGQHSESCLGYFQSCSSVDMSELTEEQSALKKEVECAYDEYILEWE
jgi:hypothetical protein